MINQASAYQYRLPLSKQRVKKLSYRGAFAKLKAMYRLILPGMGDTDDGDCC
jgi:hypothetical protein